MTLYKILFSENFESLKSSDINQGLIGGVVSPYSVPASDDVLLALVSAEKNSLDIGNRVSRLHQIHRFNIKTIASINFDAFEKFRDRLKRAFELNDFFKDDDVLQAKLAEFLTYCYASQSRKHGYLIYDDIEQAKKVVRIVYKKARVLGLTFLPKDVENLLKTLLLTVFLKLPKETSEK